MNAAVVERSGTLRAMFGLTLLRVLWVLCRRGVFVAFRSALIPRLTLVLIVLSMGQVTWGHGFGLMLNTDANGIPTSIDQFSESTFTDSSGNPIGPDNLFFDQFSGTANPDGSYRTVEGFAFTSGTWPVGSTYTFNVVSPLYFSDGNGAAAPAYVDPTNPGHLANLTDTSTYIHISDRYAGNPDGNHPGATNGTTNVYGNTSFDAGFQVSLTDPHELAKDLYFGGGVNRDGEYGFSYNVTVHFASGQTLTTGPLVDVWATDIGPEGGFASNAPADQQSNAILAIYHSIMQGDFNLDGKANAADIQVMLSAMTDLDVYQTAHNLSDTELLAIGDLDRSGVINNADLQSLLTLLASGNQSPQGVPEPASILIAISAIAALLARQWQRPFGCG
jgi:hypothetical protein